VKKLLALSAVLFAVLLSVSSCADSGTPLGSGGVMVSGTATLNSLSAASPGSVTVKQGSATYTASVTVPAEVNGLSTCAWSLPHVPMGTYTVTATFTTPVSNVAGTYSINGGNPIPLSLSSVPNGQNYDWTATINGVSIQGDETVDVSLSNNT
jgi:hypothetical protein